MQFSAPEEKHNPVADALSSIAKELGFKPADFFEAEYKIQDQFMSDFFVKPANLVIEINARRGFYPYTHKENQRVQWKSKLIRGSDTSTEKHALINLNARHLEGLLLNKDQLRESLKSMITKIMHD